MDGMLFKSGRHSTYRVFFVTAAPLKSSKYRKVNIG